MKVWIIFVLFGLGSTLTYGIRVPGNCGNSSKFRITSLQPEGTNEEQWNMNYIGNMFKATYKYNSAHHPAKITWDVDYQGGHEHFEFDFYDERVGFIPSKQNTINNVFYAIHNMDNTSLAAITISKIHRIGKVSPVSFKFNVIYDTDSSEKNDSCSIKSITFKECATRSPLLVDFSSSTSEHHFACEDGYHLLPVHRSPTTKCLTNAIWRNQDLFRCYKNETSSVPAIKKASHIGLAVGIVICCILVIIGIIVMWKRRQMKRNNNNISPEQSTVKHTVAPTAESPYEFAYEPEEVSAGGDRLDLISPVYESINNLASVCNVIEENKSENVNKASTSNNKRSELYAQVDMSKKTRAATTQH